MKRIAVINQKGGVGKTTTTVNLGAALAHHGRRSLLLDLDPQANMTVHLDKRPDLESHTLTNLLLEDTPLQDLVQETGQPDLFMVPSDTSLAGVEQVLANRIGRETILREALDAYPDAQNYDFVLFDCPPSLGVLSANALVAADYVVIPMQAEYLSLQGMAKLLEVIQLVQKRLNPSLQIACVLPCMLDSRTNLSTEVLNEIETHFGSLLTRTRIRNNVKLAEAPSFGRSIFEHAPDSNGARDYAAFALEFLRMIGEPVPVDADQATAGLASHELLAEQTEQADGDNADADATDGQGSPGHTAQGETAPAAAPEQPQRQPDQFDAAPPARAPNPDERGTTAPSEPGRIIDSAMPDSPMHGITGSSDEPPAAAGASC